MLYEHRPGPDADLMQATSTAKGAAAALAASGGNTSAAAYASDDEEETTPTTTPPTTATTTATSNTRRVVNAGLARLRLTVARWVPPPFAGSWAILMVATYAIFHN